MNLNAPVYDNVLAIDQQLLALEQEVSKMDNEFKDYNPRSALPQPQIYPSKIPNGNYSDPSTEDFSSGEMGPRKVVSFANVKSKKPIIHSTTNFKQNESRYNNLPVMKTSPVKTSVIKSQQQSYNQLNTFQSMNQTDNSVHGERVRHIKPQIAKEYSKSLYMGKPDLSILEEGFENGAKFYEQQYSDGPTTDIRFRETESQIQHEEAVNGQLLSQQADSLYDSFM